MPLLVHPVRQTFGVHRLAVEHPRLAHGEIGDVDHLLDFAVAFRLDLAVLERHERTQRILVLAQQIAEAANGFAAPRCGNIAPRVGSGHRRFDDGREVVRGGQRNTRQGLLVGRVGRCDDGAAATPLARPQANTAIVQSDAETFQQRAQFFPVHVVFPLRSAKRREPSAYIGAHMTTRSGPSPSASHPLATIAARTALSVMYR